MAKKDKVKKTKAEEPELKKDKKAKKSDVSDSPKPKKGKKEQAPEPEPKKGKDKGKDKGKPAKEVPEEKPAKKKKVKADQTWDESTGSGGGDFFTLPKGETEVLIRIRSVISVGQCVFEFQGKKDSKATSGIGMVLECWPYEIKKDKIKVTSKEPAIIYHTMKALKGNKDSHWAAQMKELSADNPSELMDVAGLGTIFTSDKGFMYLRKRVYKAGLAERKATPKLTKEGHAIPNLGCMTKEALLELNPILQVKEYVLKAVNYVDSEAEECVAAIRKDKPDFAILKKKDGKDDDESSSKGKKDKKKKKKLKEDEEY